MLKVSGINSIDFSGQHGVLKQKHNSRCSFGTSNTDTNKSDKVSFSEGACLIGNGFTGQIKDMAKTVITHPLKTIGTMAVTSLGLMALPFLGISISTGGAVLALTFGITSLGKTAINIMDAYDNYRCGNNQALRKNLTDIGGNTVDLALTVPFMPRAIKQLKLNVPSYFYNTAAVLKDANGRVVKDVKRYFGGLKMTEYDASGKVVTTFRDSLWKQIRAAKTLREKYNILIRQDRREAMFEKMNEAYKQVARDRGFKHPKDIKFFNDEPINTKKIAIVNGGISISPDRFTAGCIRSNARDIITVNRNYPQLVSSDLVVETIGHEFRHIEQNVMMEMAEGLPRMTGFDVMRAHTDKVIKRGTPEHILAEKFQKAFLDYRKCRNNYEAYLNNALEVDARNIGECQIANQIINKLEQNTGVDVTLKPGMMGYNPAKDVLPLNGIELSEFADNL